MSPSESIYCLDTNALINPWNKWYPPDLAPGYWQGLGRLLADGRVVLSEEVREEIAVIDDGLFAWAKANVRRWHPLDDNVQAQVTSVMAAWGKLVDTRKNRSRADPFVIATAKAIGAKVVTTEGPGTEKRPTIPFVCIRMDVKYLDVLSFVREAGIRLA